MQRAASDSHVWPVAEPPLVLIKNSQSVQSESETRPSETGLETETNLQDFDTISDIERSRDFLHPRQ